MKMARAMADQKMTARAMKIQMTSLLDTQSLNVQARVANPFLLNPRDVSIPIKIPIAMEEMEEMN